MDMYVCVCVCGINVYACEKETTKKERRPIWLMRMRWAIMFRSLWNDETKNSSSNCNETSDETCCMDMNIEFDFNIYSFCLAHFFFSRSSMHTHTHTQIRSCNKISPSIPKCWPEKQQKPYKRYAKVYAYRSNPFCCNVLYISTDRISTVCKHHWASAFVVCAVSISFVNADKVKKRFYFPLDSSNPICILCRWIVAFPSLCSFIAQLFFFVILLSVVPFGTWYIFMLDSIRRTLRGYIYFWFLIENTCYCMTLKLKIPLKLCRS